ncbi:uncharacterized protein PGTG_22046 [Puccinia graminis f. sp. tritici CRL 75-36-700-3]|uniref:Uncharacterized protein n=1 Tax=Puccinia graminis f. sp. tritici (strain CRL 75-36-700-3 / race SCCL) TaxID=418459 RepID=H6QTH4_PUCGT|nr:uncharacterized protein PGTG_22046 [Puccinia graminis f. sp. tritici CRL 75-36-700-3]EHS64189.1 hypothetical protein PGTG_22046 [Puccinia graminis f. sp. tritici CRL 75-36-700-3]
MAKKTPYSWNPVQTSASLGGPPLQIEAPSINRVREFKTNLERCETQMQEKVNQIAARMELFDKFKV